jgi:vacuolar-type H+-ATPase subunit H
MTGTSADRILQESLAKSAEELDKAKTTVHNLANELINVVDIIEPALADQTKRIRDARMASVLEIQQITESIKTLRLMLLSPESKQMLDRGERLLAILRDLEEFRSSGALESFAKAFSSVAV